MPAVTQRLTATAAKESETLSIEDGCLVLWRCVDFADSHESLLNRLIADCDWQQPSVTVYGKTWPQPRLSAWYGDTAGPHQHLAIARARAIEEGIPLVRSANTGISAVFDSYGREIVRIGLSEQGIVDTGLPKAAASPPYGRYGDYAHLFLMAIVFLSLLRAPNN